MNYAVVLAGGNSVRFGLSKQFFLLHDKPLLSYSLETFNNHPEIDEIILVYRKEEALQIKDLANKFNKVKMFAICGATREGSVKNGLSAIQNVREEDKVLIHDSARPLVSTNLITRIIRELDHIDGVVPVVAMEDSLINIHEENYVNRNEYKRIQTPQGFKLDKILDVFTNHFEPEATDDGSMFKKHYSLGYVDGEKQNLKVTTKEDIALVEAYLEK